MTARYIIGDVFDTLATLPDNSVDLVFSSPPFLALRSYLPADHPDKGKEIGSEATPADFLDTLLDVVEACDRVLAPHGSLCFELGDTFAGSGGAGGDYAENGLHEGQPVFRQTHSEAWPLPKSLSGIPTLFAWSLAYGRNLLRPERTTPRWRIRNVVVWARPNPPVGALGDKFRPATSYLTVACKSDKRWFDLDAVRTEAQVKMGREVDGNNVKGSDDSSFRFAKRVDSNPAGAPPLDYWEIPTQPYAGSHYATFPSKLVTRPVKSMCPERVCRTCGEPSRRIVETERIVNGAQPDSMTARQESAHGKSLNNFGGGLGDFTSTRETIGWTDCGCGERTFSDGHTEPAHWRPGVVLDPFAGSGTTLSVATGHGRDAIGIDIDARNAELALERVGPLFLSVEKLGDQASA